MANSESGKLERWVTIASGILSLLAFGISAAAFYFGEVRRQKDVPFEVIPKSYEKYYEMNKIELEKPYLTHMFVTADRYVIVKQLVETAAGKVTPQKRAQYLLEERAVADFMFTFYEQTLFQWEATKDKERGFISEVLAYLRGRLLRNPRLIYWWRQQDGGLETSYEKITRDDWLKYVQGEVDMKKPGWCDAAGPFRDPASDSGCKPRP